MSREKSLIVGDQKRCKKCLCWFPLSTYRKGKSNCNSCLRKAFAEWTAKNPERVAFHRKKQASKGQLRQKVRRSNPVVKAKTLVNTARVRARKAGICFDLTWEFILQKMIESEFRCSKTGVFYDFETLQYSKQNRNPFGPSIDRIDNNEGYTTDNVQVVCWFYNLAKSTFDEVVLWDFMRNAVAYERSENATV